MILGWINQEDVKITNLYGPNIGASNIIEQTIADWEMLY